MTTLPHKKKKGKLEELFGSYIAPLMNELWRLSTHLKKFMALALESGTEPGRGCDIGAADAKWPLNIMQIE